MAEHTPAGKSVNNTETRSAENIALLSALLSSKLRTRTYNVMPRNR